MRILTALLMTLLMVSCGPRRSELHEEEILTTSFQGRDDTIYATIRLPENYQPGKEVKGHIHYTGPDSVMRIADIHILQTGVIDMRTYVFIKAKRTEGVKSIDVHYSAEPNI